MKDWNLGPLGGAAGYPLKDPRARVHIGDVVQLIKESPASYDAILLDIDNGPEGLTRKENDWLYTTAGIAAAQAALRPDGVLAYWSAGQDPAFTERLKRAGLSVEPITVRAHRPGKGRSTLSGWLGKAGQVSSSSICWRSKRSCSSSFAASITAMSSSTSALWVSCSKQPVSLLSGRRSPLS